MRELGHAVILGVWESETLRPLQCRLLTRGSKLTKKKKKKKKKKLPALIQIKNTQKKEKKKQQIQHNNITKKSQ
eukprot:NODE_31332_length_399_cov_1.062500.p2 GENE.NODE_31332_length_399_cov_1.062500~~NODE_31332_length_399_cov_1.062500.p2  ORF type:complete len:74 (+),score=25.10 NODE_31332_length_399_cov_1.062500:153-374(+)